MSRFESDEAMQSHELVVSPEAILEACGPDKSRYAIQLDTASGGISIVGIGIAVRDGREMPYVELSESNGPAHRGILKSAGVRLGSRLTLGNKSGKLRTDRIVGVSYNPYKDGGSWRDNIGF